MGKGDIKSKKGKISSGSYGKRRPHKVKKASDVVQKKESQTKSA
ncbi:MAG: 30S ribosomal protein THX [Pyrinomonadaceae bacterium]|nr:30S ribosomal protein THX [Sphingobacteriaceae bacterium]